MDTIFLIKLLISFFIGGLWIMSSTVIADKYGSKIGGFVASLPSTVMFALLFIGWTQTPAKAAETTTIMPAIEGIDYLYILLYMVLVKKGFWKAVIPAFVFWAILAGCLIYFQFNNFVISVLSYCLLLVVSYVVIEYILKIKSISGGKKKYTPYVLLVRTLVSGCIVAIAVFSGKIAGPIWGGVFSAFPAMFTSTMAITYFSQGPQFSIATMKSLLLGTTSVFVYIVAVRYTYISLGLIGGTITSIIISYLIAVLQYNYLTKKMS